MKTILLSLPYGMSARNFLRSNVFKGLKEKAALILVTPLARDVEFMREFSGPDVTVVDIPRVQSKLLNIVARFFFIIEAYFFTRRHPIATLLFLENQLYEAHPVRYFFYVLFANTIGRIPFLRALLRAYYYRLHQNPILEKFFSKNPIDLVFTSHGYIQEEVEILTAAQRRRIRTINMVHSWDNIVSKSGLRQITSNDIGRPLPVYLMDNIIVWNQIMKQQLRDLYGYPEERIFISGIPQFDAYTQIAPHTSRETFLKKTGLDPTKKILYYMAASPALFHDQMVVIKTLIEAMKGNKFIKPCQLIIRTHPKTEMSHWPTLFKEADVFIQEPQADASAVTVSKGWNADPEKINQLAETIYHCDIVLNGSSTTSIDAAAFDKPVVCYGFDGDATNNAAVRRLYDLSHYSDVTKSGGIRIAWSETELIEHINRYLDNPTLDALGRARIRDEQCYKVDGQAGNRIAQFLLKTT